MFVIKAFLQELRNKACPISLFFMVVLVLGLTPDLFAQEDEERSWELMVGAGVMGCPDFTGSKKLELTPFPAIIASYETPVFRVYGEFNELGLEWKLVGDGFLSLTAGAGLGSYWREAGDRADFAGTASIKNDVRFFGQLDIMFPYPVALNIGCRGTLLPIGSSYSTGDHKDKDYLGVSLQAYAGRELVWFPLFLNLNVGVNWVDMELADALHSNQYATDRISAFSAKAGIHDIYFFSNLMYFCTDHIVLGGNVEFLYLLGDGAESPFTEQAFQPALGVYGLYRL